MQCAYCPESPTPANTAGQNGPEHGSAAAVRSCYGSRGSLRPPTEHEPAHEPGRYSAAGAAAVSLLRSVGAEVIGAGFVIDLPDLGGSAALRDAGIHAHSLVEFPGH